MKSYCYYNYCCCCCCCCCCWYYYYHYYYYYYYYYIVQIFYTLVIKLNQNSYPDEYFCVQGSTCETQLWNQNLIVLLLFQNGTLRIIDRKKNIFKLSQASLCLAEHFNTTSIFWFLFFKFDSLIILNFRFSFFLGRVHRSWKNSERVSAQSVCCAGICCWKQFEGKNTVVWNVY